MNESIFVVEGKSYHLDLTLMPPETLEALKGSIRKWGRIVKSPKAVDMGCGDCPLCDLYGGIECAGCPVRDKAETAGCFNTPYASWVHHQANYHDEYERSRYPHCKECLKIAREMLAFLIDLLPVVKL